MTLLLPCVISQHNKVNVINYVCLLIFQKYQLHAHKLQHGVYEYKNNYTIILYNMCNSVTFCLNVQVFDFYNNLININ